MLRTLIFTLLIGFTSPLFAEQTDGENLFQKGLAAYQNKQFEEARDNFQKLLSEGQVTLGVLHNLALTELQLDHRALSMALWRKALSIDPDFTPARQGRSYLEQKFNMRPWERDSLQLSIRRFLEVVSIPESLIFLAGLLAAAGWFWIRYLASRRVALEDELPKPNFPSIAVLLTFLIFALLGLLAMQMKYASPIRATIVTNSTSLRSLPTDEGVSLMEIPGGSEVMVRRHEKEWTQVQNSEGSSGWVKNSDLMITSGWTKL